MAVEIRETPLGGDLTEFLDVVDFIYRHDPNYVRPLDHQVKETLSPKNPFFQHAEAVVFTAHRMGWCVGRITAQVDHLRLQHHPDDTGHFGFLDSIDDPGVVQALLDAAGGWLRKRGLKHIAGPLHLSMNDQVGMLVDGFDTPPMLMMPHHLPYQGALVEQAGFTKLKDAYAWRYQVGEVPKRARKAYESVLQMPEVQTRAPDMKNLAKDIRLVVDVFNDAWSDNWGFVPLTEAEMAKMASEMRLLLDPRIMRITTVDGEPAAVALAVPNVNEVLRDLDGKLFPFGVPKLLWRLKVTGLKSARLIILGVRKKFRNVKKYAALSTYLYVKMNQAGAVAGYTHGELSYTMEDNHPINLAIKFIGGERYKTYRLYTKPL